MEISVRPQNALHALVIVLLSTLCRTGYAATGPCKRIDVTNTKSHPNEEGIYHLSPSATCEDNTKWIWSMKERENYIYYSSEPRGWRIGAIVCRGNKAALYSEGEVDNPFDVRPGTWKEWNVKTSNWDSIGLRVRCIDGTQPDAEASINRKVDTLSSAASESTSVGRVMTYVVIVVVIIGCLFMFQRKKQKRAMSGAN